MTGNGRQLLLLRHAKAVIGGPGMADFDRPLADRGRKAADRMGHYLAGNHLVPDLVLCSPARRTRETWEIAARALPPAETRFLDALYDFGDGEALLAAIRREGGKARRLMLVTHNPATQSLALLLSGSGNAGLRRQMAEKYPTAGLAVLGFGAGSWTATAVGSGTLEAFIRPRDLMPD
jgi:phosphohistidine phosphatase